MQRKLKAQIKLERVLGVLMFSVRINGTLIGREVSYKAATAKKNLMLKFIGDKYRTGDFKL
jgi:hypothetical protein